MPQIMRPMTPKQVYQELGSTYDILSALVQAELSGNSEVSGRGLQIAHAGYVSGTTEFNAATSLYRITR